MGSMIDRFRHSDFLRHNAIMFIGAMAISVVNYLYYPVLARMLEPAAFGEVQTVIALFLQIAIFLNVLALLTVNITANYDVGESIDNNAADGRTRAQAQATIFELERLALAISLAGLLLAVVLGPLLQRFFKFDSALPFVLLALAIVVSVPGAFRTAYLRGRKLFAANSWAGLIGAVAKLGLAVAFVAAGWGVTGAITGLVLAQVIAFLYAGRQARRAGFGPSIRGNVWRRPDFSLLVPELKYAGLVLAVSLSVTALYSIDIIAIKHYFDAQTAGLYAGIATVARIVFFLTGSIPQVLLPSVKLARPAAENRLALRNSMLLLTAMGGTVLLVFWLLPELVIRLLMGSDYLPLAGLLPHLALVIFIVSVLNLVLQYFLALRRYAVGFIAILGLAVTCGLVVANHSSPQAIVDSMLYGSLCAGILLAVWAAMSHRSDKSDKLAEREA